MPSQRPEIERVLRELYAARVRGDLGCVCGLFAAAANFEIASVSHGNPIAVNAHGTGEFLPLLKLLIRAFRVSNQTILSMIIDSPKAAVHWRANVYSKITGATVPTEFMDIVEIEDGRISSYIEFFVPR
jgi:ketosteroid isomerase-like protein